MPIEFHCPGCGKLMRTPDETAGRKGKCPHCAIKVRIPEQSLASSGSLQILPPMPQSSTPSPVSGAQDPSQKWKTKSQSSSAQRDEKIEFVCPRCQRPVKVSASAAGKQGQCPQCRSVVRIPSSSTTPEPFAGLQPITANGGSAPQVHSGLIPIGNSGLTPLGPGDLTPLDALASPSPLDPFSTPGFGAETSPFSSSGSFGGNFAAVNPYSSPQTTIAPRRFKPSMDDSKRRGLPWEIPDAENAFFGTIGKLLNGMGDAFSQMKCTGGYFKPLGYFLLCEIFTITIAMLLLVLLTLFLVFVVGETPRPVEAVMQAPNLVRGLLMVGGVALVYLIVYFALRTVGLFFGAMVIHLLLAAMGGANRSYEVTFRVYCYAAGTALPLRLIPVVGALASFVVGIVLLVKGFMRTHETSAGVAIAALLIPIFMLLAVLVGLIVVMT